MGLEKYNNTPQHFENVQSIGKSKFLLKINNGAINEPWLLSKYFFCSLWGIR